jgi:hypothetical protein
VAQAALVLHGCGLFWCDEHPEIGSSRCLLTSRPARWVTGQVGRNRRSVSEVTADLGCGWRAVMDAVVAVGEQLIDHPDRIGQVTALDECRRCVQNETLGYRVRRDDPL